MFTRLIRLRGERGITFIELLLVILIIGVLAGVSVPQFRKTLDNFELENFTKDIFFLCRYLQGSAIGQGKIYCLNIDRDKAEFRATVKVGTDFKPAEGRFGRVYRAQGVTSVSLFPVDRTAVYFYPDGSIDNVTITFENKEAQKNSLVIAGVSGVIKIL